MTMPRTVGRLTTLDPVRRQGLRIVVASDGSESARPALAMARMITPIGSDVSVLGVVEPQPAVGAAGVPCYDPDEDARRARALQATLLEQAADAFAMVDAVPVTTRVGTPAEVIAAFAQEVDAHLVITGRRTHGRLWRMVHGETPLGVVDRTRACVLVVPETCDHLPRSAIVATGLDDASTTAAACLRTLLPAVRRVHLVHVRSVDEGTQRHDAGWRQLYEASVQFALDRAQAALALPHGAHVRVHRLSGSPTEELLEFADFTAVDLLVLGHHHRSALDRLARPDDVAARVVRSGRCAALLVPERARLADDEVPEVARTSDEPARWPAMADEFTRRELGRLADLEVRSERYGAQRAVPGLPFAGVSVEARARTAQLMFGAPGPGARHLTHEIFDVLAMTVRRRGERARLQVEHAGGYTDVVLER